jgi:hypothetical protein
MNDNPTDPVTDVDPQLDADLERWHTAGGQPRVRILGPVHARSRGEAPKERTVIGTGNIGRRRRRVEVIPESEPLEPAPQQEPAPPREPAPRTPVPSR